MEMKYMQNMSFVLTQNIFSKQKPEELKTMCENKKVL